MLRRVAQDLGRISARLAEVPALVVDDESDLASINTHRPPTLAEERRRTAINRRIVEMLRQLPRAQYVGYTATPFANVFINPADAEDLFPKDFIIGLPRPKGYMGAREFHDLDGLPDGAESDPARSNRRAFIRDIRGQDESPDNLLRAIDSFVITGALKLYRQVELPADATRRDPFRHHTMLVHSSRLQVEQQAMR
ncbi:MAG: Z1 domain-containing protein, partial [Chloroflexi bacterium]|nr:Z1 domain-containing protein [Chloroflexota bacterium]